MASSSYGTHGGKRENAGRKKKYEGFASSQKGWNSQNKRIYLSRKIFDAWKATKIEAGYDMCSDSEFAAHLLSLEYRRRSDASQTRKRKRIVACQTVSVDEVVAHCSVSQAPSTSTPLKDIQMQHSESPSYSPIQRNQAHSVETDGESDCGALSVTLSASFDANETTNSCIRANTSIFTDDEEGSDDRNSSTEETSLHNLSTLAVTELNTERPSLIEYDTDDDFDGDEGTVRLSDLITEEEEEEEEIHPILDDQDYTGEVYAPESYGSFLIPFGPHRKFSRKNELYSSKEDFKMVQETKFICCLDLLLAIFKARCQTPGCTTLPSVKFHFVGVTIIVNSTCSSGHAHRFCSSHQINDVYASNLQIAASIMLSGNQFAKVGRMAKFLHLEFLSKSTYYRFQRLYVIPEINEWWSWMKGELVREFSGQDVIVGGDGQCDSPGFNAKNICYFMMEVDTNYILDIEVLDKRHVGLISTNMEKEAVQRSLNRLNQELKIVELVTDASTSVTALLGKQYKDIVHSLDVWHKTKSIKKCLDKLGKPKAMRKVKDWSAHIVRHFWYCSSTCRKDESTSDEEALRIMKDKWIGLLHHICNIHQWLGGQCDHDDDFEHDQGLPWFDRRDNDFVELQKIILNPGLLESFKFYTRFRHTGGIECANSLGLMYTPKHTSFSYRAYKARRQLAAIDWNFHQGLPQATKQSGEKIVTRKYNQRTRQWDIKKVKVEKGYDYIPVLMSKILQRRDHDFTGVTQIVDLNASDPALISPTIAHTPAPSTKEIAPRRSRFGNE